MAEDNVRIPSQKRKDYISWENYFMGIAFFSAQRSKDPVTQVGACIVNEEKRIVGVGYNGMPDRCHDNDFTWGKGENLELHETKHAYVCHAEMNAIMNKTSASLKNCTIYVSLFPCNECAKIIIQSGIKKVVYYSDKKKDQSSTKAAKLMFRAADILCKQHKTTIPHFEIDFESINTANCTESVRNQKRQLNGESESVTTTTITITTAERTSSKLRRKSC